MVMDCYYFSPAYVFVKEDCPPKKPHTTRDGAKEYMVRFHPHDFEFVSHSLLFKKDEWISIDYIEGEMEEALRELGHEPGTRRVGADELYDALIETMRAGRLIEVPPGMPD